jgi:hypothetical protein
MKTISVTEKMFGYFPQVFVCQDTTYRVEKVLQTWTKRKQRNVYLCFRVKCEQGKFELWQNNRTNEWRMVTP